jgi:hypothetical protein
MHIKDAFMKTFVKNKDFSFLKLVYDYYFVYLDHIIP